jgi:hypothetical protein
MARWAMFSVASFTSVEIQIFRKTLEDQHLGKFYLKIEKWTFPSVFTNVLEVLALNLILNF